jgi:hypothetical protein
VEEFTVLLHLVYSDQELKIFPVNIKPNGVSLFQRVAKTAERKPVDQMVQAVVDMVNLVITLAVQFLLQVDSVMRQILMEVIEDLPLVEGVEEVLQEEQIF